MGTKVDRFACTECLDNSERTKVINFLFSLIESCTCLFHNHVFYVKILCGRLTFQQIHETSLNLLNDGYGSKWEKGHTHVSSTVNQCQFSDWITFHSLSWQILAWLYETVGRLQPYQSMNFGRHAIVDGFAPDYCMTAHAVRNRYS